VPEEDKTAETTDAGGNAAASEETKTEETSSAGEGPEPFDMSALERGLAETDAAVVSRTEFDSVKRQAGQVKELQRQLAAAQKAVADAPTRDELGALTDALMDLLPEDRQAALRAGRESRETASVVEDSFTSLEKRLFDRLGIKDENDAEPTEPNDPKVVEERLNAQWAEASKQVLAYAAQHEVELTREDYDAAQAEAGDFEPAKAAKILVGKVDERRKAGAAKPSDDLGDRKADAAGGDTTKVERDGSQGNHDLTTIAGIARARKAGAIDGDKFLELYREINRSAGR
jgi:hypothetical protein